MSATPLSTATLVANIGGLSRRVSGRWRGEPDEFDPQFDYIKEPLGGYGLYYRSAMEATGALVIATPSNGFAFDAATPTGRGLAAAYRDAISDTDVAQVQFHGQLSDPVGRAQLIGFAAVACLCQLRKATDHDLPLLQDIFVHAGAPIEAESRRQTLRLILDLSQTAQEQAIGQADFRQLVYFRSINDEDYEPLKDLALVARRWRLYQAREYFAFAFNRLLGWVVRWGQVESDGGLAVVPSSRLWELVDDALDNHDFVKETHLGGGRVRATTAASDFADRLATRLNLAPDVDAIGLVTITSMSKRYTHGATTPPTTLRRSSRC